MNFNDPLQIALARISQLEAEVTQLRQQDQEHRQVIDRLSLAIAAIDGAIYEWDIQQGKVDRTQGLFDLLGYSVEEAEPTWDWWIERIHPDDREKVKALMMRTLVEGDQFAAEYRVKNKDNRDIYIWDKGRIVRDSEGQAVRVVGNRIDITECREIKEALIDQKEFLRNVIDTNPNFICVKDREGRFTLANQALAEAYGTTIEGILGKTDADLNANTVEVEQFRQDDREVIETLQPKLILEEKFTDSQGQIRWLQTLKKPLLWRNSEERFLLAVATDITECKRSQESLQGLNEQLEQKVQQRTATLSYLNHLLLQEIRDRHQVELTLRWQLAAVEAATDGIAILNLAGEYIYLNQAHAAIYGYGSASDLIGKGWQVLNFSEEISRFECNYFPEFFAKGSWRGEVIGKKSDGTAFPVEISLTLIAEGGFICVCRDITERKRVENALKESRVKFQKLADNLPVMIYQYLYRTDGSDAMLYASSACREIYEVEPEALVQNQELMWTSIHPDDREWVRQLAIENAISLQPWCYEWRLVPPSGRCKWVRVISRPEQLPEGDILWEGVAIDISEGKQAEEALRQSEERFRNLVEATSDWVWEVNKDYAFTYISPKIQEILGYQPEEAIGKTFFDLMTPEEAFRVANSLGFITAQHLPFSCFECQKLHRQGQRVILEMSGVPVFDSSHKFSGYRGISRDITERKQAEEALRQSEEQFRIIFEREAIGVALTNLEGRLLASNFKLQEMLGYSEDEFCQMTFRDFTHPDDLTPDVELFGELVAGKRDNYQLEKRYIRKDGQVVWGYLTISLIRKANGTPQLSIATVHDVTERKQMVEALQESEERFRQLAEHIDEVFWMVTANRDRMLYVSPAYEKIWGRSCASLYESPTSWFDAIHPDDRESVIASLPQQVLGNYNIEYRVIRPDGSFCWVRDRAFLVRDEKGQTYRLVGLAEDITARKQGDEKIRKALEKEKELNELKSRFVNMMSHEFRTPLGTILSSSELLEHYRYKMSDEKQLTHLQRIQVSVKRLTELLDNVLTIGKVEAGRVQFNPEPIDLIPFCQELLEELQALDDWKDRIHFQATSSNCATFVDRGLLRPILTNLLANAIKYSAKHSPIEFHLEYDENHIQFMIQDFGIGIPEADRTRLFQSFQRASNVGNIPGTGLGLAIVKHYLNLHGGEISVSSSLGAGTTFTVSLPNTL